MTTYAIDGKYADDWETIDTVTPEDGGLAEAQRLTREYAVAHAPHPIRYRPATLADLS